MFDLLQIVDTTQKVVAKVIQGDLNGDGKLSMMELLISGGIIMIPLALLLLIVIFVFFERYIAINKASKLDGNFMNIIRDHIVSGNLTAAKSFARNTNNPIARIIDKGIQRIGKPIDYIERNMENIAQLEMFKLEKNLGILSVIARIAPIFGFIGTLAGLMQLFSKINYTNTFELNTIAGGIYVKLVTSISGLLIGLVSFIAYNYLNSRVERTANQMEIASADFLDILQEPTR
jgi:biopolymer transport protein ExbB